MGGGRLHKIPFYEKRSFSLRASWKATSDVDIIAVDAIKPRGGSAKNSYTFSGKRKINFAA